MTDTMIATHQRKLFCARAYIRLEWRSVAHAETRIESIAHDMTAGLSILLNNGDGGSSISQFEEYAENTKSQTPEEEDKYSDWHAHCRRRLVPQTES